ncbi:MAG TPA: oligopeptide transporter, OPT family [Bacteroidota bacterium]|nr:oligopeptide transporter, OPT family [Bacteroidota bacterium]
MQDNQNNVVSLPENAYRELKSGEEYIPVIPASKVVPQVTTWSVAWGLIMAIIFSAAAAYSGLKIGQVMEAAIPISIIAVGVSSLFKKKYALSQNVIIQSIGASSGVIVAGAVFTIPGLYILNLPVNFFQIFFSSLFGGFLGILFLIPFRKYFVKDMHGKFPFPEATATTEILITGEKGGKQAGLLAISGLIGGLYDFLFQSFQLWSEVFTSRIFGFGQVIAEKTKILLQFNVSAMIVGFGYLVGLKYALIITLGSFLSWWVFVPLINQIGNIIASSGGGVNIFAAMAPEQIFTDYVRHIGIGAIAMAGIIGVIKAAPVIGKAFSLATSGLFGKGVAEETEIRTQTDIKMTYIIVFIALTIIAIFIYLLVGFDITLVQAIIALLTIVIISFLFTTVAANAIAIVGSNPVSGMTLMTLILASVILSAVGLSGPKGMTAALVMGGIVCTALSMAGGFITDLKIGYWIGTTPKKQESWKFLGTLVSAATVGIVIFILNQAYGFTPSPQHPNPLVAPQANAMAAVIQPLMTKGAEVHWILYLVGVIIALVVNFLGISPLPFALGMYLPMHLNIPLLVGGIISYFMQKSKKGEAIAKARHQRATLIASGFIAGAALLGVVGALLKFFGVDLSTNLWTTNEIGGEIVAIIAFVLLMVYFVWDSRRAKAEE